jgi:hypothetical protein
MSWAGALPCEITQAPPWIGDCCGSREMRHIAIWMSLAWIGCGHAPYAGTCDAIVEGTSCSQGDSCYTEGNDCSAEPTFESCECGTDGRWECLCGCYGRDQCPACPPQPTLHSACAAIGSTCSYPDTTCVCTDLQDGMAGGELVCE